MAGSYLNFVMPNTSDISTIRGIFLSLAQSTDQIEETSVHDTSYQSIAKTFTPPKNILASPSSVISNGMLTYCTPKCVHLAAVILEINF